MLTADTHAPGMLSRAQWRTVRAAAWVLAIVVVVKFSILPFAQRWFDREQQLNHARQRLADVSLLVSGADATDSLNAIRSSQLALQPTRVLRARSRSLAASALQSLVQEMADASNVSVTRLDVASSDTTSVSLPISLSANGDIFGLSALLERVRQGRQVLTLDKLSVQVNSAMRGAPDVLQMTLTLRAPVIVE